MSGLKEKSFEYAVEIIKQIISISAILLGISITFFEKFNFTDNNWALITSWILLLISILIGLFSLMGIVGSLGKSPSTANVYDKNITKPTILLIIIFITSFGFLIFHTSKIMAHKPIQPKNDTIYILKERCCKEKIIKIKDTNKEKSKN